MAVNPANVTTQLNNPTERANELNDPQFQNEQGYFPYDLTHQEFVTPRFGEVTPTMSLDTVPGDRIVHHDNSKTVLNQINGNFLGTINEYLDTFYIPLRSLYPTNYEKFIPNPTKGQDLPNAALPQVPFFAFIRDYLFADTKYSFIVDGSVVGNKSLSEFMSADMVIGENLTVYQTFALGRMLFLTTILSRGQLLDYLGLCLDNSDDFDVNSTFQRAIDRFQGALYTFLATRASRVITSVELPLVTDSIEFEVGVSYQFSDPATYRDIISSIFERGHFPWFGFDIPDDPLAASIIQELEDSYDLLINLFDETFTYKVSPTYINDINTSSDPFRVGHINIAKCLAYQQVIAQYYSNNSIDNIFTSELFMQLLRSVMFPVDSDGFSFEPTFVYNGVSTEYDYISAGAFYHAFLSDRKMAGRLNRGYVFSTLMFLLRRSLRYGDYFTTARPNMLAVGQLSINVTDGAVSPIDVTKNLLMQRYLNAVNYIGRGFLQYFASIYGVTPSDTGTFPRFVAHRKIALTNNLIENTADNQGYQTTNLVGYSDDMGFDVFIDDLGVLLCLKSYDVLPVYKSGIDSSFHLSDRFDYFNPMLQGIGDQPILNSELVGDYRNHNLVFGYTMRNSEYKYKVSRAHGGFVNSATLRGFLLAFPMNRYAYNDVRDLHIDSDFIRDKPIYLDYLLRENSGISPGEYFHFAVVITNQVQCARKIQATPPVLF